MTANTDDVNKDLVVAKIDALIAERMVYPEFQRQLRVWGEHSPKVAAKIAAEVLRSPYRFFTPFVCRWIVRGRNSPLALRNGADLLVAIGAADKGYYPTWGRGDEVYYSTTLVYYLLLEAP